MLRNLLTLVSSGAAVWLFLERRRIMQRANSLAEALNQVESVLKERDGLIEGLRKMTDDQAVALQNVKANAEAAIAAAKANAGEDSEAEKTFLDGLDRLINHAQTAGTDKGNPTPEVPTVEVAAPSGDADAGDTLNG